jgi:hypothetical protein
MFGHRVVPMLQRVDLILNFFHQLAFKFATLVGGSSISGTKRSGAYDPVVSALPLHTNITKRRRISSAAGDYGWVADALRALGVRQSTGQLKLPQVKSLIRLELMAGHAQDLNELLQSWLQKFEFLTPALFKTTVQCAWLGDGVGLGLPRNSVVLEFSDPEACAAQCGRTREVLFGTLEASRCRTCARHWCRFCVGIHECRFCNDDLPEADRRLRRIACFDFTFYIGAYIHINDPERNAFGYHVTTSSDKLYGFAVCPLRCSQVATGCALALCAAFRLITHLHRTSPTHSTFQIVHNCPGVVRQVCDTILPCADESLLTARSLYSSLVPGIWIVWDGGRKRKAEVHFQELAKRFKARE